MTEESKNETSMGERKRHWRKIHRPGAGIAMGLAIGVAIGAAQGNWAIGLGVGVALAVALEANFRRRRSGDNS